MVTAYHEYNCDGCQDCEVPPEFDDGAGADLREYPLSDLISDYNMMLELKDFNSNDPDVIRFAKAIDYIKAR